MRKTYLQEKDTGNDNKIIEEWKRFVDCLDNDDRNAFIFMIKNCYNSYHKSMEANIKGNNSDSCLTRTMSLFMALILYQQKQIDMIKSNQRFLDQFI